MFGDSTCFTPVSLEDASQSNSGHKLGEANANNGKNEAIGMLKNNPDAIILSSEVLGELVFR